MLLIIAAVTLMTAARPTGDDCRYEADRSADISASGISMLDLSAGAGSLRIVGRSGISTIQVRGHACASSAALLQELQLRGRRSSSSYRVETLGPENIRDNAYARIDLVIEVPTSVGAHVDDGSGEAYVSGIASLDIDDGSGELEISNIDGDVSIDDGSGEIIVTDIGGNVSIDDGSGEITVKDIRGSVLISDGSGSIRVARVGRDLTVKSDGSGDIQQSGVNGEVRIPERYRRDRRGR